MDIKQRLKKMEAAQKSAPLTKEQAEQELDDLLAKHGLTRETAVSQYGSVGAFCYALMLKADDTPRPEPADGLTAQERFLRMLKKN